MNTKHTLVIAIVGTTLALAGCSQDMQQNRQAAAGRWELARSKINFQLAKQAYDAGQMAECKKQLERAMAGQDGYAPAYLLACKVALRENRIDDAQNYLELAVHVAPDSAEAWYGKALLSERFGSLDEAIAAASQAAKCDASNPEYLICVAELQVRNGQAEQALATLVAIEGKCSTNENVQSVLADLYMMTNNYHGAALCLQRLQRMHPDDEQVQQRLAICLVRGGQGSEALPLLVHLVKKSKGDAVALRCALGECYLQAGDYAKAEAIYGGLAKAQPSNADLNYRLAECYAARHDDTAALERVKMVLKVSPQHADAHALAGYLCFAAGDLAGAEEHLRQAAERTDQPALVAALLHKTFLAQGRSKDATEVWAEFGGRADHDRAAGVPDQMAAAAPFSWTLVAPVVPTANDGLSLLKE